jgi:hypothetical protein
MTFSGNIDRQWYDLVEFQLNIAKRWFLRGNSVDDLFAKFFFYFTGINALYFLWTNVDDFSNEEGKRPNETKQFQHLVKKLSRIQSEEIVSALSAEIDFLQNRRPVQRMDRRKGTKADRGKEDEGREWRRKLQEHNEPSEQLMAMAGILYLVRSNLVHGSKGESGGDEVVIQNSIEPLRILLEKTIELTKRTM